MKKLTAVMAITAGLVANTNVAHAEQPRITAPTCTTSTMYAVSDYVFWMPSTGNGDIECTMEKGNTNSDGIAAIVNSARLCYPLQPSTHSSTFDDNFEHFITLLRKRSIGNQAPDAEQIYDPELMRALMWHDSKEQDELHPCRNLNFLIP